MLSDFCDILMAINYTMFFIITGSLNVIILFGKKKVKNLKFLGIPNKMSKNEYFNGRNYNWGIVTIYTIRGYLGLLLNYL